ncbi:MAG: O-antigen ligase family protein [Candidatus Yanofskybacteria bacterium]|nr:O-antigen ligase family protein [Candidatus Yanofskybacteria bacterium]
MSKFANKESNLVKFLRFGIYLTALVPLLVFRDLISPFHFGKVVIFRSLVEILGLERMGGLWTFWHYFLFYIILTSVLTKKEHWRNLLNTTIFAGILSAFYGFFQKTDIEFFLGSGGRARIFGTIGNAALFAGTQLLAVFLSLTLFFQPQNTKNQKLFYLFAFAITSVATLMTAVRGSVLAYAVGITVFAFLWGRYKKSRFGRLAFNYLVGLAVLFIVFSLLFGNAKFIENSRYLSRITDLSLKSQTTETRFWAWEAGLKGWVENPKTIFLGWGPENFNIPFSKYFNPKFFVGPGSETLFDRAHNMFVEILATMGLVGLLSYLGIFAAVFAYLRRWLKNSELAIYGIGFMPLVIAYIIHNSFIFDTSANFIIFFTIMGFISWLVPGDTNKAGGAIIKNKAFINILAAFLIIFIPWLIYETNILPTKANYATTRAIVKGWAGDVNGSIQKYKEALTYDVPGKYEYRHRLAQYLVGPGGPSVKEGNIWRAYEFTIAEVDKNIAENKIDYLPYLYGSRLNIMLGKDDPKSSYNDIALAYSMKALELSPTFVRTYYELAQAYLNKKDYPNAIKYFQRAVELNPDVGVSHAYLGAAKIESGDLSGAEDLEKALNSKNFYTPREVDFQRLINAYLKTSNFERLAWIYEQMIKINPKEPQNYASLATAYANLGRIDEAVIMARKAVEVDPSFEPDARIFLKSLGKSL